MFHRLTQMMLLLIVLSVIGALASPETVSSSPAHDETRRTVSASVNEMSSASRLSSAIQVAAGSEHTCAITSGGGVKCWGYGLSGSLGDGRSENRFVPKDVVGLTRNVLAIDAGGFETCVVLTDGSVKCWGNNPSRVPDVVDGLREIRAISVGGFHQCALTTHGSVQCWGSNASGQLGDGTTEDRQTPTSVVNLIDVQKVAAGGNHTCALLQDGSVACWGDNSQGQLGNNSDLAYSPTPVPVQNLSRGVTDIAAGFAHTCAVLETGRVKCWGENGFGQLGNGSTQSSSVPADVIGLENARAISANAGEHTCVVTTEGDIQCWGYNRFYQLGDGTSENRLTPVKVIGLPANMQAVTAGRTHSCAVTEQGEVMCWGSNVFGQGGKNLGWAPVPVFGLDAGVEKIDIDFDHACAVVSGGAKCWGNNGFGQLGDGTKTHRPVPTNVSGLTSGVVDIGVGLRFSCALTVAGAVKCWGENAGVHSAVPVVIPGLEQDIRALSVGGGHACVLTTDHGVKCWGDNRFGQLGDGTTQSRNTPVDVIDLTGNVQAVTAGYSHTCALMKDGGIKCWGLNGDGQLGDGTRESRTAPVDVLALPPAQMVTAGGDHTCAITIAGALKCWGANHMGQLGNGSQDASSEPVDVAGLTRNVIAVDAGSAHTCAITTFGRTACWGENRNFGQLGNGTTGERFKPDDVIALVQTGRMIAAGNNNTCIVTTQGAARCWGDGSYGKLGDNYAAWNTNLPGKVEGVIDSQLLYIPLLSVPQ